MINDAMWFLKPIRPLAVFISLLPLVALGEEVTVTVDMTAEGRKMPRPTRDNPAYYLPRIGGFHVIGPSAAGEHVPPDTEVIHFLSRALAAQGYLVSRQVATPSDGKTLVLDPPPSLVLVVWWGCANPNNLQGTLVNEEEMVSMVAGKGINNLQPTWWEYEDAMRDAHEHRYFVMVTAYDFDAYRRQRKKVLLWSAKMSLPAAGRDLADAYPAMIATGEKFFGRETERPLRLEPPAGAVEIGQPEFKGYLDHPDKPGDLGR